MPEPKKALSLEEAIKPRPIDIKSGWKNNSKVLAEIVSVVNDEIYVKDEYELMEQMDRALEYLKKTYLSSFREEKIREIEAQLNRFLEYPNDSEQKVAQETWRRALEILRK